MLTSPVLKNKQSGMYLYQGPGQAGIDVGCTWILRNKLTPDEAFGEAFTRTKLGELPLGKREWRNGSGERCHVTMTQLVGAGKVVIKNAKRGKTVYKTEAEVQAALGPKHVGYYETQGGAFLRLQKGDQAWAARGAWPKCMHNQCKGGLCQGHPNSDVKKVVDKKRQLHLAICSCWDEATV